MVEIQQLMRAWYVFPRKVVVDCPSSGEQQVFLCQKWLADDEGDCLLERDLYESEDMRQKRKPSKCLKALKNFCSSFRSDR